MNLLTTGTHSRSLKRQIHRGHNKKETSKKKKTEVLQSENTSNYKLTSMFLLKSNKRPGEKTISWEKRQGDGLLRSTESEGVEIKDMKVESPNELGQRQKDGPWYKSLT